MSKLEIHDKIIDILDASTEPSFNNNVDVLNECFGANRSMYMHACYPQKKNEFIREINTNDKIMVWMPKLYGNSSQWRNSISEDGSMIYEIAEEERTVDWMEQDKHDLSAIRLVFLKHRPNKPYVFVGAFINGRMDHLCHTYVRIATKVRLIGNPSFEAELLDDSRNDKKQKIRDMADRLGLEFRMLPYENQITLKNDKNRIVCMIRPSKDYYQLMSNKEFLNSEFHPGWRVKYAVRLLTIEEVEKVLVSDIIPRFGNTISISDKLDIDLSEPDYVLEADLIDEEIDDLHIEGAFRETVVKQRVNQSVFRDRLMKRFSHCCLCDVASKDLLRASHIKPWSVSSPKEKVDVNNGLLLCPNHDLLFDQGYISFDDEGKIIVSNKLNAEDAKAMCITKNMHIDVSDKCQKYLEYHRDHQLKE